MNRFQAALRGLEDDLIEEVSRDVDLTRKDSEVIIETIFDSIVRVLRGGDIQRWPRYHLAITHADQAGPGVQGNQE